MSVTVESAPASWPVGKAVSVLGGLVSLGLIVGLGYWSYELIKRDVNGVPVVQAVKGPMRVQPDSPGGRPAENQGLAVNAVAATGSAEAPADQLTLAPKSVELLSEDKTTAELTEITPEGTRQSIESLVDELANGVAPLEPLGEAATDDVSRSSTGLFDNAIDLSIPGVNKSWHPPARPENLLTIAALTPTSVTVTDIAAGNIAAGTRLAQLGAFDSEDEAKAGWVTLAAKFGDVMQDKQRVIEQASTGGRTFYRLRALGFTDLSDARRFCSVFVAENADCIPVTAR